LNNRKKIVAIIIALAIIGITAGCVNEDAGRVEDGKQTVKNETKNATPAPIETPNRTAEGTIPANKSVSPAKNISPVPTGNLSEINGVTNIEAILANPDAYLGKIVTVQGRPSGNLSDRTNNEIYWLTYTVEETGSLNKSRFIKVETRLYPKERLECIREISVTGLVQYENKSDSGEANKIIITEQSHKVVYTFDVC